MNLDQYTCIRRCFGMQSEGVASKLVTHPTMIAAAAAGAHLAQPLTKREMREKKNLVVRICWFNNNMTTQNDVSELVVFVMLVCACCGRARAGKGEESRVCCEGVPFVFCLFRLSVFFNNCFFGKQKKFSVNSKLGK